MSRHGRCRGSVLQQVIIAIGILVFASMSSLAFSEERQVVLYSQKEFRYQYYQVLLHQALKATEGDYGVVDIQPYQPDGLEITEARGMALLQQKRIQITFVPTSRKREESFRAVPIPLDQGLLGLRLLLIKAASQPRFDRLQNETELREKMLGGFNTNWSDYEVYGNNGLKVLPATKYETLFKMLESGRFDYFSRGLIEVWSELENFKGQYPDLQVENRFAFYYNIPVYFFVHKDNEQLAQRIEVGLQRIQASGAFSKLFQAHYGEHIARAKLDKRQIIILQSPQGPQGIPVVKPFWWPAGTAFPLVSTR
jgi:ABC-type amino acid transport substrate-binding protein